MLHREDEGELYQYSWNGQFQDQIRNEFAKDQIQKCFLGEGPILSDKQLDISTQIAGNGTVLSTGLEK
ncbi:MAG: hypothetical protein AB3N16_06820 [Flavobacteriaceae bacterium]